MGTSLLASNFIVGMPSTIFFTDFFKTVLMLLCKIDLEQFLLLLFGMFSAMGVAVSIGYGISKYNVEKDELEIKKQELKNKQQEVKQALEIKKNRGYH